MKENIPKVFISYTVRDGKVNEEFLSSLDKRITSICQVYIDLIHNNSIDKQKRVVNELQTSDMLILIKTDETNDSLWVRKEILIAKEKKIPIYEFEFTNLIANEFLPITHCIIKASKS